MAGATKESVWISAKGHKHKLSATTGKTKCGLTFKQPYPTCVRTDPMCKTCIAGMR